MSNKAYLGNVPLYNFKKNKRKSYTTQKGFTRWVEPTHPYSIYFGTRLIGHIDGSVGGGRAIKILAQTICDKLNEDDMSYLVHLNLYKHKKS